MIWDLSLNDTLFQFMEQEWPPYYFPDIFLTTNRMEGLEWSELICELSGQGRFTSGTASIQNSKLNALWLPKAISIQNGGIPVAEQHGPSSRRLLGRMLCPQSARVMILGTISLLLSKVGNFHKLWLGPNQSDRNTNKLGTFQSNSPSDLTSRVQSMRNLAPKYTPSGEALRLNLTWWDDLSPESGSRRV